MRVLFVVGSLLFVKDTSYKQPTTLASDGMTLLPFEGGGLTAAFCEACLAALEGNCLIAQPGWILLEKKWRRL